MKRATILLVLTFMFFASCSITDLEISVTTATFEGEYYSEVDCDGRFKDNYLGRIEISIIHTFGTSYEIILNGRDKLIAKSKGNKLVFENQIINSVSTSEKYNLNGEMYESSFQDLVFTFTTTIEGEKVEDCILDLKWDY